MDLGEGAAQLLGQLCLQMGLPADPALLPAYLSGEVPWLLDLCPGWAADWQ